MNKNFSSTNTFLQKSNYNDNSCVSKLNQLHLLCVNGDLVEIEKLVATLSPFQIKAFLCDDVFSFKNACIKSHTHVVNYFLSIFETNRYVNVTEVIEAGLGKACEKGNTNVINAIIDNNYVKSLNSYKHIISEALYSCGYGKNMDSVKCLLPKLKSIITQGSINQCFLFCCSDCEQAVMNAQFFITHLGVRKNKQIADFITHMTDVDTKNYKSRQDWQQIELMFEAYEQKLLLEKDCHVIECVNSDEQTPTYDKAQVPFRSQKIKI